MSARGTIVAVLNDLCLQTRKMAGWAGASWSVGDVGPDTITITSSSKTVPMTARRLTDVGRTIAHQVGPLPFDRLVCGAIEVPAPAPPFPTNSFEPTATILGHLIARAEEEGWGAHIVGPHDELLATMSRWAGDRSTHVDVVDVDPEQVSVQIAPERGSYGGVRSHADPPGLCIRAMLDFLTTKPRTRVAVFDHNLRGWVTWDWTWVGMDAVAPEVGSVSWLLAEHRQRLFGDLWAKCEAVGWRRGETARPLPESVF